MNNVHSEIYGLTPEEIKKKKKSISNKRFRTIFNIRRIERTNLYRLNRYVKKKYDRKKKKM